ncbi:MAG: glutamine-hydrolyzing GMP synthase [Pseudomonadota bacterium]|nr:glutamine-hydrolyzing GMP synthase [Pseudomonadota bacterium]MEC8072592.1 glutamine-hydrolyzing GMP synthase [Pseudomonadota bacterium]
MAQQSDIHSQRLLIVDFGSQYTQLIARRVRECGVYCEIYPFDISAAAVNEFAPRGVILSGGPESVTGDETPRIDQSIFALNVPVLGICYGMQAMAQQFGGQVNGSDKREFGHARIQAESSSSFIETLLKVSEGNDVWMSHGDKVTELPPGFVCTASSGSAPIAAMENAEKRLFGVQFHPEVTHTKAGFELLSEFAHNICGCDGTWTAANIVEDAIARVREQVGSDKVVLGLSGGVDSSVVAALLARAIGPQLTCIFVDNGLLRKDEKGEVESAFNNAINDGDMPPLDILTIDAEAEFLGNLQGLDDPESKRKVIGSTFIEVFDREAKRLEGVKWLAQGTIYPDVIESAASKYGKAHVIKSHHNVGGLPERMAMQLVEPLRELFKDEVRKIGLHLGLPESLIMRHPFPGPGLGVRILGQIQKDYADVLREADAIFIEELRRADLYRQVSQAFAVYLPVKSVGVVGDARRYEHVIALRAVETIDFMTARWAHLPYEFIEHVSNRIINEIAAVSRVVYDVSSKPPATIEWE